MRFNAEMQSKIRRGTAVAVMICGARRMLFFEPVAFDAAPVSNYQTEISFAGN